eukprot:616147-Pyramimonas_sp.AAC.1
MTRRYVRSVPFSKVKNAGGDGHSTRTGLSSYMRPGGTADLLRCRRSLSNLMALVLDPSAGDAT